MRIIKELNSLKSLINKKSKNISSLDVKNKIKQSYEIWLVIACEVEEEYPSEYETISENFEKLYLLEQKHHFSKKESSKLLNEIIRGLDKIRLSNFSKGVRFKEDYKENIYGLLKKKEFSQVVNYLKKAESTLKKDPETSCAKSRETIEELFRIIRERSEKRGIKGGTLGQHARELEKKGLISSAEYRFFTSGLYSFLSEKGNHANKERKDENDSLFGFKIVLVTIEYLKNLSLF